jgi:uncharacterized protein (TIGR02996 family)
MRDEASFLKALVDKPEERSTRLAYANWLDEHDRPREAEFLRLQMQVEELNARLIELGGQLDTKWLTTVGNASPEQMRFVLRSGRAIELTRLTQRPVYGLGQLATHGAPRAADNERALDRIVTAEQERTGRTPYLIRPQQRPVESGTPDRPISGRALLPDIVCIGTFCLVETTRDEVYPELDVIWFQTFLALPVDPGVRQQIRAIDWKQHAYDDY